MHISDGPGKDTTIVVDLPQANEAPTLAANDKVVLAHDPEAPEVAPLFAVIDHVAVTQVSTVAELSPGHE